MFSGDATCNSPLNGINIYSPEVKVRYAIIAADQFSDAAFAGAPLNINPLLQGIPGLHTPVLTVGVPPGSPVGLISDPIYDPESEDFLFKDYWRVVNKRVELVPIFAWPEDNSLLQNMNFVVWMQVESVVDSASGDIPVLS